MKHLWQQAKLWHYSLPLKSAINFAGNQLDQRTGFIVQLKTSCGTSFWGEAAPLIGFSQETTTQTQQQLLVELPKLLAQQDKYQIESKLYSSVAFALSCALAKTSCSKPKLKPTTSQLLQGKTTDIWQRWQMLDSSNITTAKLKVGREPATHELRLINQLINHNPKLKLHLDANQSWDLATAINFARQLPSNISYIEEPLKPNPNHIEQLTEFYNATGVYFALDETVQARDYQFKAIAGLKMQVIKPSLVGSIARCQQLITQAKTHGVTSCFSSSFESNLAIEQIANLALQLTPNIPAGLDTLSAFRQQLVTNSNAEIEPQLQANSRVLLLAEFEDKSSS